MKYVRMKDGITTSDKVTHELIEHICDAGYLKTLEKGACVRIGKEWFNFFGHWVDIIDKNGGHYSIRPDAVKKVTKELLQADTIEELCDGFIIEHPINAFKFFYDKEEMKKCLFNTCMRLFKAHELKVFGCIKTDKGLVYVAKMNEEGALCLI